MALTHVAVSGNAAGQTKGRAFREFFANVRDIAGNLESGTKRFNPKCTQGLEFSSAQSQQFALLVHWSPNLRRSRKMNSRMRGNVLANELPAVRYFASREAEFPAARERQYGSRFTGNDLEDWRTAGPAVLGFLAEQSGGHARHCEAAKYPFHPRVRPQSV